jgi:hypothetical protein
MNKRLFVGPRCGSDSQILGSGHLNSPCKLGSRLSAFNRLPHLQQLVSANNRVAALRTHHWVENMQVIVIHWHEEEPERFLEHRSAEDARLQRHARRQHTHTHCHRKHRQSQREQELLVQHQTGLAIGIPTLVVYCTCDQPLAH